MALAAACTNRQGSTQTVTPVSTTSAHTTPVTGKQNKPKQAKPVTPTSVNHAATSGAFVPQAPGWRVARVSVPGPYVALTFDDGPHPVCTPQVLDILRRNGAKATFFVLGENAVRHKQILARAAAEGHEIGSHTWSHKSLAKMGQDAIVDEMDRTAAVVQQATGKAPMVMRPPYGATNKQVVALLAGRYGTPSVLWDVDTADWKHPGVSVVVQRAVNGARNGSIILLHDIHASTVQAVEGVVRGLQARGFKLVTVSELIAMGKQASGNVSLPEPPKSGWILENTPAGQGEAAASQPVQAPVAEETELPAGGAGETAPGAPAGEENAVLPVLQGV